MLFQKHKLKDVLEYFDPAKTEYQNMMELNNYRIIYDSGNIVFSKLYPIDSSCTLSLT